MSRCVRTTLVHVIADSVDVAMDPDVPTAVAPDAEYRIRDIVQEAMKFMRNSKRDKLTADDVNSALRIRNAEALFGFVACEPPGMLQTAGGGMFVPEDQTKDLKELAMAPLPSAPSSMRLSSHWLSIEGVQPAIPQNPKNRKDARSGGKVEQKPVTAAGGTHAHPLSKEHRLYFDKVVAAVRAPDKHAFAVAIQSVGSEVGLHQLLPYFCDFVETEIKGNMRNRPLLLKLLSLAQALLDNRTFNLEPYLHQLMPSVLTCVVGKHLCRDPMENHWMVRQHVYIPPGPAGSEDAFKNMFDSLSGSGKEHDFDSDLLSGLDNADATPTKPDIPHPDIRNDYGLNEDKMDLGDEADAEDVSKKAAAKERVVAAPLPKPAKMRVKSIEPHTTAAVPQDDRATGYGAETSPCGLPGVPQEFCDAWLKTHCGPDQLTDEHIKNMRAANNPYDWCKLLFENEPGITLPEVDVFPWMINNQEVDLSEALQDKIRFGHPLASQGVSWDKVDSLNLIRPRRQENPPPPPLAAVIVEE